ncbi:GntR family transcriptional regulator [Streptomyces spororaveus]|uniref:GntR family transcriptional regulator n=1 Tax=Streptomyces TaxID=1883 RepID=UPI003688A89C
MNGPAYQRIAADLRAAIERGDYPPGSTLPRVVDLAATYGTAKETANKAVSQLEAEGLVDVVRRRGTVVREHQVRRHITRTREVYRDELGYYFDPAAQGWRALEPPLIEWRPCPRHIAELLDVAVGSPVLVRDRVMGDPETREVFQLATSYLPEAVARGTRLEQVDTGAGGIYARMEEEMGYGPLQWYERVSGRTPSPSELAGLQLPAGVALLCITRTTSSAEGRVLEVNDTRMSAEKFEIGYPLTRHEGQ